MLSAPNKDVPIAIKEAQLLFGKTGKQVYWAIWKEKIVARQSLVSENWILSLNSCIAHWGQPVNENLCTDIREDWENAHANLSHQG